MASIFFFFGENKGPWQHCSPDVFMKMRISTRERLLGLPVISVWSCGSGRLCFGQLCKAHGVLQREGEHNDFPLSLLAVMGSWCLVWGNDLALFPFLKSSDFALRRARRKPLSRVCAGSICWEGAATKGGPSPCPHGAQVFSPWHKPALLLSDMPWVTEVTPWGRTGPSPEQQRGPQVPSGDALPPLSREGASFQEMAAAFRSWECIPSLVLRQLGGRRDGGRDGGERRAGWMKEEGALGAAMVTRVTEG